MPRHTPLGQPAAVPAATPVEPDCCYVLGHHGFVYAAKEQPLLAEDGGRILHVSVVESREGVPAVWRVELP